MRLIIYNLLLTILFVLPFPRAYSQVEYSTADLIITGLSGGGDFNNLAISPLDQNMMICSSLMTGVFLTTTGPANWKMIHYSQLLHVTDTRPCFHPKNKDIIFASGSSGLKMTLDRGLTWNPVGNLTSKVTGLAIHPVNADTMLAGSGSSIYRSINGGTTWVQASGPSGTLIGFHFDRTSPDEAVTCFAATSDGLWRSDNGGATWTNKALPAGTLISFAGASNKTTGSVILYCGIGTSVYRSTDRGDNWTALTSITGSATFLLASDVNPSIVWAGLGGITIRRSVDAGDTWSSSLYHYKMSDSGFNLEHNYFTSYIDQNVGTSFFDAAIAPGNPDFMAFTTSMVYMYTENGGVTWKSGHSVSVAKEGEPVPKSFLNTGLNNTSTWHYYVDPFEQNRQYICYTDIGFARSVDSGENWLFWPYWGPYKTIPFDWVFNLYEIAFDPEIPGKMWGAFSRCHDIPNSNAITSNHVTKYPENERYGGIGFSSDFAANWEDAGYNTGLPNRITISVILDPSSPKNNRTLYAAVYEKGVYKSTDDGHTWSLKSTGLGSATNMHVVRLQLHKDTLFCLVTGISGFSADGVGLYRSINGAESWEKVNASKDLLWPKDFAVNPVNTKEIYIGARAAGTQSGALWRTTDGGLNWTAIANKGNHFGAYLHPTRPGWIYMTMCEGGTGSGLWLSKDNGSTWLPYNKIPHRWIQRIDFDLRDPDMIYVSTFGSSVMKVPADPDNQLSSDPGTPESMKRLLIYPNPCTDYITVENINSSQPVNYRIFDLRGKLVNTGILTHNHERIPILLNSGMYILSVCTQGHYYYTKFIKR